MNGNLSDSGGTMRVIRYKARGVQMIHFIGLMMLTLIVSALAIDFGWYFGAQNQLQTGADAAAIAAVDALYRSSAVDPEDRLLEAEFAAQDLMDANLPDHILEDGDITFGFIDPGTKAYDPDTFTTPNPDPDYAATGGYNAVRVAARRSGNSVNGALPAIMANMFGVNTMDTAAFSVALIDNTVNEITDGGLRPFYACEGLLDTALADGNISNNEIRIYGQQVEIDGENQVANCPPPGSGNWGFADLRNCSPGAVGMSTMGEWILNGYPGSVTAGECYSTQPGNAISSTHARNALDTLIANQTVITLPLYNQYSGGGSNTQVTVSGFVGFVVTDYQATGSASNRYIQGYFTQAVCTSGCRANGGSGPSGASIVKLRLAGRQL